MKTFLKTMASLAVAILGLNATPAQAQVSLGIATPGFSLGVGPGAGYVGVGGVYPGYPVYPVVPAPIYAPRPVFVPPPIYPRPYYGGYAYGRPGYGYGYGHHPYPGHRYR